jgi:two-component system chemotaxis sensor kinase CheA
VTFDPSRYLDLFVLETREHLAAARGLVPEVKNLRGEDPRVHALFRHLHSVKGMSACMGFEAMVELADAAEQVLSTARDRGRRVGAQREAVLRDVLDTLGRLLDEARVGEVPVRGGEVERDPRFLRADREAPTLDLTLDLRTDLPLPGARAEMLLGRLRRLGRIVRCEPPEPEIRRGAAEGPIRIRLETRLSARRLAQDLGRLDDLERFGVVPTSRFEGLAERAAAAAADAAKRSGRSVRLATVGTDVEIDPRLLRALWEPLVHLARNAVDHGIEAEAGRLAAGKPAEGLVTFRAERRSDVLRISVEDDGAGFDVRALRLAAADDRASLVALATLPGVTTRPGSGGVSGRGVGLDAVAHAVERLGGRLEIRSRPGKGATVEMEFPVPLRRGDAR